MSVTLFGATGWCLSPGIAALLFCLSMVVCGCSLPCLAPSCCRSLAQDQFVVLMESCYLREQLGSVFYHRYMMVPTLRVFCSAPGVRGALLAKYGKAASPGPISDVIFVPCLHCWCLCPS